MTDRVTLTLAHLEAAVRQVDGFVKGRAVRAAETKARLGPSEAAVRREIDMDLLAGNPERGRAPRIARRLRFDPDIRAYRDGLKLPKAEKTVIQWIQRTLDRLMK